MVSPIPSTQRDRAVSVSVTRSAPAEATAMGFPVASTGDIPAGLGLTRDVLATAGFTATTGSTLVLPTADGPVRIVVGIGDGGPGAWRDAGAAFARAVSSHADLALQVPDAAAAAEAVEGVLLARYRYDVLRSAPSGTLLRSLAIVGDLPSDAVTTAVILARATMLARDLANTPHSHLTATQLGAIATELGGASGLEVEVVDKTGLEALGIGGLLGVNAGSAEPPVMIRLRYRPRGASTGRLALVGKGIMYDSGGLALKPGDAVHAQMKNDMSGAAAILAAMVGLRDLGCTTEVTGYLMCTDSMPGPTALALGDVITIRGGTTVEVVNTDAEGRLVMADAIVLAREDAVDAIVDIATLTGAMMRALGKEVAGVIGTDQPLIDQVLAAGTETAEPIWQMPLWRGYRSQLDSTVADMKNLGWGDGGAITAALFLAEFPGDVPWAHIDMAGVAQADADKGWLTAGCTGYGARLLVRLAMDFRPAH